MPDPANPQSFNRFAYARNNPLKFTDPTGHWEDEGCGSGDLCELPVKKKDPGFEKDSGGGPSAGPACQGPHPSVVCLLTQTPQPTLHSVPPSGTPEYMLVPGPTSTPTPIPPTPEPPPPYLDFRFYIDWSKVDTIDAIIDGIGLGADLISVIPATAPAAPIAQSVGTVAEGVGLVKSSVELIQGDPRSMLVSQTTDAAKAFAIAFRLERLVPIPGIGSVGNLVSLGINLQPKITLEWVQP